MCCLNAWASQDYILRWSIGSLLCEHWNDPACIWYKTIKLLGNFGSQKNSLGEKKKNNYQTWASPLLKNITLLYVGERHWLKTKCPLGLQYKIYNKLTCLQLFISKKLFNSFLFAKEGWTFLHFIYLFALHGLLSLFRKMKDYLSSAIY